MTWDKESIIRELRRLYRQRADLSFTALRGSGLWGAAFRYFGSYRKAVEAAGIDYRRVWRRRLLLWDRPRVVAELKRLHRAGREVSDRAVRRDEGALYAAALRCFDSYAAAVEAAGLDYDRVRHLRPNRWGRDEVTRELRRLREEGQPLHHAAMARNAPAVVTAAYRYFGTYREAVEAAGIDYDAVRVRSARVWDRDLILSALRGRERDGESVWRAQVKRDRPDLLRAAERRFGSYARAVREAGISYPPHKPLRHWTEPLVLRSLRESWAAGADLRHSPMKRRHPLLFEAARYYFGSYVNAIHAAGIDYAEVIRRHGGAAQDSGAAHANAG